MKKIAVLLIFLLLVGLMVTALAISQDTLSRADQVIAEVDALTDGR